MFRSLTLILMQLALVIDNQTPAKLQPNSSEYFSSLVRWAEYFLPTTASPHPGHNIRFLSQGKTVPNPVGPDQNSPKPFLDQRRLW